MQRATPMTCRLRLLTGILLAIALSGCGAEKSSRSYCNSQCARCGCSRHVETESGVSTRDDICQNDLSQWLSGYRTGDCSHEWIPVSGWGSQNNIAWDGQSPWNSCLEHIRRLSSSAGPAQTSELLKRYFAILEVKDIRMRNVELDKFVKELKPALKSP